MNTQDWFKRIFFVAFVVSFFTGCAVNPKRLEISAGQNMVYVCECGAEIKARYFSLSDDSLHFVKVILPDGREYTLPQVVSASGVRYTDEHQLVWWTKGDSAFAQTRGEDDRWEILYNNCRRVDKDSQ
jgi:membrane-bound inhibitor of C-type lysozyme